MRTAGLLLLASLSSMSCKKDETKAEPPPATPSIPSTPSTTAPPATPPPAASAKRPCTLLTQADVESIGRTVTKRNEDSDERCTYQLEGVHTINLFVEKPGRARAAYDQGKGMGSANAPLTGLGEDAYWSFQFGRVGVLVRSDLAFFVQTTENNKKADPAKLQADLTKLAQLVIAKL